MVKYFMMKQGENIFKAASFNHNLALFGSISYIS